MKRLFCTMIAVCLVTAACLAAPPGSLAVVDSHSLGLSGSTLTVLGPNARAAPMVPSLDMRLGQATTPAPRTYSVSGAYEFRERRFVSYALLPTNAHLDLGSLTAGVPDLPKFHFGIDLAPWAGPGSLGRGAVGYQATHSFHATRDGKWIVEVGFDGSFEQRKLPEFDEAVFAISVQIG